MVSTPGAARLKCGGQGERYLNWMLSFVVSRVLLNFYGQDENWQQGIASRNGGRKLFSGKVVLERGLLLGTLSGAPSRGSRNGGELGND